jgi:hypothetical protein
VFYASLYNFLLSTHTHTHIHCFVVVFLMNVCAFRLMYTCYFEGERHKEELRVTGGFFGKIYIKWKTLSISLYLCYENERKCVCLKMVLVAKTHERQILGWKPVLFINFIHVHCHDWKFFLLLITRSFLSSSSCSVLVFKYFFVCSDLQSWRKISSLIETFITNLILILL